MSETKHEPHLGLPLEIPSVPADAGDDAWAIGIDPSREGAPETGPVMANDEQPALPPERVRFTAPLTIRREGDQQPVEGAVFNLSTRGVAACADVRLRDGERIWVSFRLGLAEDPVKLLCEVIWCRDRDDGLFLFGLRFANLTVDEAARIDATVNERSEGRAGEWPLPVIPDAPVVTARRGANPVVTAAAGMAAGIGLALALSVIPSAVIGSQAPAEFEPVPPERMPVAAPAPAAAIPTPLPDPQPVAEPAPSPKPAPEPAPVPVVAAVEPVAAAEPPKDDLLPRREAPSVRTPEDGDVLRPLGTADGVELALLTDGDVVDHVSFWLDNPRRLVVDVFGRENGFSRLSYSVDHALAKRLRIGNHPGKVRYVIETPDVVSPHVQSRAVGRSLVLTLSRE